MKKEYKKDSLFIFDAGKKKKIKTNFFKIQRNAEISTKYHLLAYVGLCSTHDDLMKYSNFVY